MTPGLRRFTFTCPCGKATTDWMAETPEIARENFHVFAKRNDVTCRCCGRKLTEFQDRSLN